MQLVGKLYFRRGYAASDGSGVSDSGMMEYSRIPRAPVIDRRG